MSHHNEKQKFGIPLLICCAVLLTIGIVFEVASPFVSARVLGVARRPQVRSYSRAFRDKLARELAALPSDSPLMIAMGDYVIMRDEARRCAHPDAATIH
jgi:hypothetical protein